MCFVCCPYLPSLATLAPPLEGRLITMFDKISSAFIFAGNIVSPVLLSDFFFSTHKFGCTLALCVGLLRCFVCCPYVAWVGLRTLPFTISFHFEGLCEDGLIICRDLGVSIAIAVTNTSPQRSDVTFSLPFSCSIPPVSTFTLNFVSFLWSFTASGSSLCFRSESYSSEFFSSAEIFAIATEEVLPFLHSSCFSGSTIEWTEGFALNWLWRWWMLTAKNHCWKLRNVNTSATPRSKLQAAVATKTVVSHSALLAESRSGLKTTFPWNLFLQSWSPFLRDAKSIAAEQNIRIATIPCMLKILFSNHGEYLTQVLSLTVIRISVTAMKSANEAETNRNCKLVSVQGQLNSQFLSPVTLTLKGENDWTIRLSHTSLEGQLPPMFGSSERDWLLFDSGSADTTMTSSARAVDVLAKILRYGFEGESIILDWRECESENMV